MSDSEVKAALPFECFHRYAYASELLSGKRVLDLASREGYGTRILAERAESVTGLDPDEAVAQDAIQKNNRDNLTFAVGSVLDLKAIGQTLFDAVVCFDAIEVAMDTARVFTEIKRVLAPGGIVVISAPLEAARKDSPTVKTFSPEEFHALLASRFANAEQLIQNVSSTSIIERAGRKEENPGENREAQYLLAIASDGAIPQLERSALPHPGLSQLAAKEKIIRELRDMKAYLTETAKRQDKQISEYKQTMNSLSEAFAWHTSQIHSLNKTRAYLEHEIDELRESMASDRKALEWRASQVQNMEEAIAQSDRALTWRTSQVHDMERTIAALETLRIGMENRLNELSTTLAQATQELETIHMSSGWKFVLRARSIRMRLLPDGTMRYRLCKRIAKMLSGG